jgi:uracil-DNA glycosylase
MPPLDRQTQLKVIYKEYGHDRAFVRLKLHHPPKLLVPGRGSMEPKIIFVGEAPGRREAETHKPFQGAAGKVLDRILAHLGLGRDHIFITNVVKYRPTIGELSIRNRTPDTKEIEASRPYLMRELDVFGSVPVVVLGSTPLRALVWDGLSTPRPLITDWSGEHWHDNTRRYGALFHPATAVYDPDMINTLLMHADGLRSLFEA